MSHEAAASFDPSLVALSVHVEELATKVALVARATSTGFADEVARLIIAARARNHTAPRFRYRPGDDLDDLARALDTVLSAMGPSQSGFLGAIDGRAREARFEVDVARAIGTPALPALARQRFRASPTDDARAARWANLSSSDEGERRVASDDESEPRSLLNVMRRALGVLRLPIRVVIRPDLAALAATGDGVVQIAGGRLHTDRQALRVTVHEIEGHVLPRLRRLAAGATMRRAGDGDLEEGFALLAEQKAGLLDRARRAELGRRHIAAKLAHDSADFWQIVETLEGLGERADNAVRMASRAVRGGGLGRERVYVPAYFRAKEGSLPLGLL